VKYLGLVIDNTLSGESIVQNIISKVNGKLKFLYRHNNWYTPRMSISFQDYVDLNMLNVNNSVKQLRLGHICSQY